MPSGSFYRRWESAAADSDGTHVGIFGAANRIARAGRLSQEDWLWWRANNDCFDAAYPDPASVIPDLFESAQILPVTCWFKESADHLLERVGGYLHLLDRYGIEWQELRSDDPGQILYEDEWQVVVTPYV